MHPVDPSGVRAARQTEFVTAFGLSAAELPRLVAVRSGKRARFALLEQLTTPRTRDRLHEALSADARFNGLGS